MPTVLRELSIEICVGGVGVSRQIESEKCEACGGYIIIKKCNLSDVP